MDRESIKNSIKCGLGGCVFLLVLWFVFTRTTYLFRGDNTSDADRITVVGFKEEPKGTIDMVYIGGSAAFVYWEPLKAYKDFGFTSYDLATNTIQAESIQAYMQYAEKYQDPKLYVIGVRTFQYYDDALQEIGLRISADSFNLGFDRAQLIYKSLQNRETNIPSSELYWDIIKYHTKYEALANPVTWKMIDNSMQCSYKGGKDYDDWCMIEEPLNFQTDEIGEILPTDEKILRELLEYCTKIKKEVLFVVCPYQITKEQYAIYNRIEEIVEEYGYDFLNTNDYYDEMQIDFYTDFYNGNHVNSLGARKYTTFLGTYIAQNYLMPDHRDDEAYIDWSALGYEFEYASIQRAKVVQTKVDHGKEILELSEKIPLISDFSEWANNIRDEGYSIIAVGDGTILQNVSSVEKSILRSIGLYEYNGNNYFCWAMDGEVKKQNSDNELRITTRIGYIYTCECTADTVEGTNSITLDGIEYSLQREGLNVVVYDNYHRKVIDSVELQVTSNGTVVLNR